MLLETVPDAGDCTPCECGAPTGGDCLLFAAAYRDSDCTKPLFIGLTPLNTCSSAPEGVGVGSKAAYPFSTTPGTCAPTGGELTAPPPDPVTFCCR